MFTWIVAIAAGTLLVAAAAAWVWLGRSWPREDLPAWITERPIAHRGLHDAQAGVPENSLAALHAAAEAGWPIELDARLLADGNVAVFHDHTLARMTGDGRRTDECSADEIEPLRLAGSDQRIPLLPEAVACIAGRVGLLIELKNPSRTDRSLERAVARIMTDYAGSWAVVSFNPFSLRWFRRHLPQVPRGQLACNFNKLHEELEVPLPQWKRTALAMGMLDGLSRPAFIGYHAGSLPVWSLARKRAAGLTVLAWTIRSESEEAHARRHADNIIFEGYRPDPR